MKRFTDHDFLVRTLWQGWRRWLCWLLAVVLLMLLGVLRISTGAEYAFATLALFPVAAMAWVGGPRHGYLLASLAAAMWCVADMTSERDFSSTWIPLINATVHGATYVGVVWLVHQIAYHLQREHRMATKDPLTGLSNRRDFLARGTLEATRAARYGTPVSVLYMDLDDFKTLNDTAGHHVGDQALVAAAQALRGAIRESDLAARLGGDEYAVILPAVDYAAAQNAARKIHRAVAHALEPYRPVSVSLGLAWFSSPRMPFEKMLSLADEQMYRAKADGKAQLHAHSYADAPV